MNEAIHANEVKRHIRHCIKTDNCIFCSFHKEGCGKSTFGKLMLNAVQQLEAERDQYKRERDAAVEQLKEVDRLELFCCSHCKHEELDDFSCTTCIHMSNWEWIGAQEVK